MHASRTPAGDEATGGSAFFVHSEEIEAWKRGMERISEDREIHEQLGDKGKERAELFSREKL
ncbi:MAG: hypothetical protein ACYC9S_03660 [Leptospirales bacterium]